MLWPTSLCPALCNKSNNGFCWGINQCKETKRKSKKKIGNIFSHITIGTNVTKGVLMIRPASLCPALCNKSNNGF